RRRFAGGGGLFHGSLPRSSGCLDHSPATTRRRVRPAGCGDDVHPIVTGSCAPLPMPSSVPPVTGLAGEAGGVSGARAGADRSCAVSDRSRADADRPWADTARSRAGTARSGAEAPLAPAEVAQGAQQVDAAEPGPVGLAEPVLGVHGLPQQEAGEPL